MDVLDPAFAPGVSHVEPGGMSTRDALRVIQSFEGRLVGADIVEVNPQRDPSGMTAMVGAKVSSAITITRNGATWKNTRFTPVENAPFKVAILNAWGKHRSWGFDQSWPLGGITESLSRTNAVVGVPILCLLRI